MSRKSKDGKKPMGRPTDYRPALCEAVAELKGANTIQEIADYLGVDRRLVYDWMERHPEFLHAVKKARDRADDQVVNALHTNAVEKHNVIAEIFWLKNRRPDEWRDKVEHQVSGQAPVFIFNIGGKREEISAGPRQVEGDVVDVEAQEAEDQSPSDDDGKG